MQVVAISKPKEAKMPQEEGGRHPIALTELSSRDLWLQKPHYLVSPRLRGVSIYNKNGGILPPNGGWPGVVEFWYEAEGSEDLQLR